MNAAWKVRRMNGVWSGPRRVKDFLARRAGDGEAEAPRTEIGGAIEDDGLNGSGPDHALSVATPSGLPV